ncbi:hypothetical protein GCM10020256_40270 [Streptomyces thermocoprophilus]
MTRTPREVIARPAYSSPENGGAAAAQLVHGRPQNGLKHLVDQLGVGPGQRGVGAHATGVGALVAVERALEVLRGLERDDRLAVGDGEQGDLRAVQELLDDDPLAGGGVRLGGLQVVGDDDALAGGETVVLDDVRRAERVEGGGGLLRGRTDVGAGGGDAGGGHHVLGEGLGALQLRGLLGGPEHRDAGLAHGVGDSGDERGLRADDDQLGAQLRGQRGHGGAVQGVDLVQLGDLGDAGVAGCAVQRGDGGVEGQRAAQGVFAGAAADDEDVHGVSLIQGVGSSARSPQVDWRAACGGQRNAFGPHGP